MATTYTLMYAPRVADRWVAHWRLPNGQILEQVLSQTAYEALAQQGAGSPENPGNPQLTWISAQQEWRFGVPGGALRPGDYTDAWEGVLYFQLNAGRFVVSLTAVTGDYTDPQTMTVDPAALPLGVTITGDQLVDTR